ncbi:response regulator transcription factor [Saccharopolyspora sp. NPDC002376]
MAQQHRAESAAAHGRRFEHLIDEHAQVLHLLDDAAALRGLARRVRRPPRDDRAAPRMRSRLHETGLTQREYDVLRHAAAGRTNPEIAEQLGLTRHTVTGYLRNAMRKLNARNRIELITKAAKSGLL